MTEPCLNLDTYGRRYAPIAKATFELQPSEVSEFLADVSFAKTPSKLLLRDTETVAATSQKMENAQPFRYSVRAKAVNAGPLGADEVLSVLKILARNFDHEVVRKALAASSRDDYLKTVVLSIGKYEDLGTVFRVLLAQVSLQPPRSETLEQLAKKVASDAFGEEAAEEVEFALGTFRAASSLARSLRMPCPSDHETRDRMLARTFSFYSALHGMSVCSLVSPSYAGATQAAGRAVMEILRGGAIRAYAAARAAHELRQEQEAIVDENHATFDDEDLALARF